MLTSRREEWAGSHIVALVELDMQKMQVRIVMTRGAIRERLRELEHGRDSQGEPQSLLERETDGNPGMRPARNP